MRFHEKVVIVTGSSSGMGRATARAAAAEGAFVVCSDLRKTADPAGFEADIDQDTDDLIRIKGGRAQFVQTDVSEAADVQRLVDTAVELFGRVDVMVNNAGFYAPLANIVRETEETFDRTMAVNAKGVWLGCKAAITQMLRQDVVGRSRGRIVNIASIGGLNGMPSCPAYCASKGAVVNLTKQLATDFVRKQINVNVVCPGLLPTAMARPYHDENGHPARGVAEMFPWPEVPTVEDVARATLFLASDDAAWVTGSVLVVDGGYNAS